MSFFLLFFGFKVDGWEAKEGGGRESRLEGFFVGSDVVDVLFRSELFFFGFVNL